jgi:hypothetical protein
MHRNTVISRRAQLVESFCYVFKTVPKQLIIKHVVSHSSTNGNSTGNYSTVLQLMCDTYGDTVTCSILLCESRADAVSSQIILRSFTM